MPNPVRISDAKLQEKIRWKPHPGQEEILRVVPQAREVVICAGRRFGKSALCAYIALTYLLQPNKKIWIVSPTYDLSQKVFNYLVRWFAIVAPSQQRGIQNRPYPKIRTATGSTLECKSAENPTSLLGEELDLIIIDEASRVPKRIWEQYLYPTTAMRKGTTVFISTPLGKNWFYHEWVKAAAKGFGFTFPSTVNPAFSDEEWKRAEYNLPQDVFAQEYKAAFLDDAAAVFRGIRDCVADNTLRDVEKGHFYVMGADLGKHRDFTVLTVVDLFSNAVVHTERFNALEWNIQKARIKAVAERYNRARIVLDSTGIGDPILDDLQREGLVVDDFKFTNKSKQQLVQKLSIFFEQKDIVIPNDDGLLDELESFGFSITDAGNTTYSAPQGMHDDRVMSLALAVWGLQRKIQQTSAMAKELEAGSRQGNRSII